MPPLADHGVHRYDLLKAEMQMKNPIQPVLGQNRFDASSQQPRLGGWPHAITHNSATGNNPAPDNPWGWQDKPYSDNWSDQVGCFLANHATQGKAVTIASSNSVSSFEDLSVVQTAGWQSTPPPTTSQ